MNVHFPSIQNQEQMRSNEKIGSGLSTSQMIYVASRIGYVLYI